MSKSLSVYRATGRKTGFHFSWPRSVSVYRAAGRKTGFHFSWPRSVSVYRATGRKTGFHFSWPRCALACLAVLAAFAASASEAGSKKLGIGREASADEIAGWAISIRPDGQGLPAGKGSVKDGEPLYVERCAACHGEFGESAGRWPVLAGGSGTLSSHDPVKSVGSYWPYASTLLDYIRRSMPFGAAQTLSNDELYAITGYVLYLNDAIKDFNFELSDKNFATIRLPNERNFVDDDRETAEKEFWQKNPCMKNCVPGVATITGRARAIDVTPENGKPKPE